MLRQFQQFYFCLRRKISYYGINLLAESDIENYIFMFKKRDQYQRHSPVNFLNCCKPNKVAIFQVNDDYDLIRNTTHTATSRTNVGSLGIIELGQCDQLSSQFAGRKEEKKLSMRTMRLQNVRSKEKLPAFSTASYKLKKCKSGSDMRSLRQEVLSGRKPSRFNTYTIHSRETNQTKEISQSFKFVNTRQESTTLKDIRGSCLSPRKIKPIKVKEYQKINVKRQIEARKALKALREQQLKVPCWQNSMKLGSGLQTLQSEQNISSQCFTDRSQDFWF